MKRWLFVLLALTACDPTSVAEDASGQDASADAGVVEPEPLSTAHCTYAPLAATAGAGGRVEAGPVTAGVAEVERLRDALEALRTERTEESARAALDAQENLVLKARLDTAVAAAAEEAEKAKAARRELGVRKRNYESDAAEGVEREARLAARADALDQQLAAAASETDAYRTRVTEAKEEVSRTSFLPPVYWML